jgi:(p)ppGpp synthase/HD superfamily hydrolase
MKRLKTPSKPACKRLTNRALAFAANAHGDQRRKYTGEFYVVHAIRVAEILRGIDAPPHVVAAGLLHDVLEDTAVTVSELRAAFGDAVTDLVVEVTDVSKPTDGNPAQRKALDRAHLARASEWGQTIKLADLIDTADIAAHDPDLAKDYLAEKAALLTVLTKGDKRLRQRAKDDGALQRRVYG